MVRLSNLSALYFLKDISFSTSNNQILEPICCLFKLIIYQYKPENTKLSIQNNSILYTIGNSYQGVSRMITGDCREDLHNLYYPLLKCIEWYPIEKYPIFYQESNLMTAFYQMIFLRTRNIRCFLL